MQFYSILIAAFIGYILGSIPSALIIGKVFFRKDIREYGSKNLGGTNAGRVLGKTAGVAVMILDIVKSVLAFLINQIIFIQFFSSLGPDFYTYSMLIGGLFAIIGHCYPLFASFRGGKAVSTIAAFALCTNYYIIIVMVVVFFGLLFWRKMVSLSSITAAVVGAILSYFPFLAGGMMFGISYSIAYPLIFTFAAAILIYRHRENIQRLRQGVERKITWIK